MATPSARSSWSRRLRRHHSRSGRAERTARSEHAARPTAGGRHRADRRGHARQRGRARSRPAEAAAGSRSAAVAEGSLRHGGRTGGARRAADRSTSRSGDRSRGGWSLRSARQRPSQSRVGDVQRLVRASAGFAGRSTSRRRLRTGARSTSARRSTGGCSRVTSTCSTEPTDGLVVVDYKTAATSDSDELDRRLLGTDSRALRMRWL